MGWHIYQLPQNGISQGIAALGDHIWLVDQGRRVLAKLPKQTETYVYLPLTSDKKPAFSADLLNDSVSLP